MIKVIVQSNEGEVLGEFTGEEGIAFTQMASKNGVEIPVSCGSGACGICRATILEGAEHIDKEMTGLEALPMGEEEILTCIAGIKGELFREDIKEDIQIVIKRLY